VRHRVRSLAASAAFAVSLIAIAAAPGAQAAAGPAAGASWSQFQGNAAHTGVNAKETILNTGNVANLELSWVGLVPDNLDWASPVIAGNSVYITGGDGGLIVFPKDGCSDSTCDPSWTGNTGPQAIATPAIVNGLAYVVSQANPTSNDGRLYVFDASGCGQSVCQALWKGIGGKESFLVSSPAVAAGVVYVGSYDGKVYAFDASGCRQRKCMPLWTGHVGQHVDSSPAVGGGMVYVGSTDGKLAAFDAKGCGASTCAPVWRAQRDGGIDIASPTVAGGKVFVGTGRFMDVYDAKGCGAAMCAPLWRGRAQLTGNTPAVANGIVYVDAQPVRRHGTAIGVVEAFDANGCGQALCRPLWTGINFATGAESSPVVANGVVYVGKGPASGFPVDSGVFSYDAEGCGGKTLCKPIGFAQTGEQQFYLASSPAVVEGHVYMGSTDTPTDQAGLYVFALPGG
jgi:outer membrane protein assembly factor BamB